MTLIAIDDNDPSIEYSKSPGWVLVGGNQEFRHTTHYADKPGLQATFTFNGTSVGVYGTIAREAASSYAIDGAEPKIFNTSAKNPTVFRQLFFQSPLLEDGSHTLVITYLLDVHAFYLDYLVIDTSLPSNPIISSSSSIPPSSTSTPGPNASLGSSSTPSRARSNAAIGAAVGGTIAGILAIALLAFILFRWRRRKIVTQAVPFRGTQETHFGLVSESQPNPAYITRGGTAAEKISRSDGDYSAISHDRLTPLQPTRRG